MNENVKNVKNHKDLSKLSPGFVAESSCQSFGLEGQGFIDFKNRNKIFHS